MCPAKIENTFNTDLEMWNNMQKENNKKVQGLQ